MVPQCRWPPRSVPSAPSTGWSTALAAKTWSFWSINTTFVCCCLSHSIPLLHYIPYASDLELTAQRGALLVTLGGLSNAVPEAVAHSARGARVDLRAIPSAESGMSPLELWCN